MKRLMYVIALSAIAVLVFAAIAVAQSVPIGQEPSQNTTNTTDTNTTDVQNSTTVPATKTITVDISNHAFDPAQLNIAPGTTVTFVNKDTEAHTATADNELFDTGELKPGESTWVFFRGSGTVTYHCELHPDMKGSIVVGQAGEGSEGEDTTPPKQVSEEAPNEPSSDAAQPTTETTQPARGY